MIRTVPCLAVLLGLILAGCGADPDSSAPVPSETVVPSTGAGSLSSLDIATGTARFDLDGAADDPLATLSDGALSFRRLDLPTGHIYLACCELTRGQWSAIADAAAGGSSSQRQPWTGMHPAEFLGVRADEAMPASGLTTQIVRSVLADYRTATGARLRLPTDAEWLAACMGGGSTSYSWGEGESSEAVRGFAVVAETRTSAGPDVVGGRGATRRAGNRRGFYDLHGNVWELTAPGPDGVARLRGGSWADNLRTSRASAEQWTEDAVPHALIGARLVLDDR